MDTPARACREIEAALDARPHILKAIESDPFELWEDTEPEVFACTPNFEISADQ